MPTMKSFSSCLIALLSSLRVVHSAPFSNTTVSTSTTNLGQWGPTIDFPVIPVAAALLPESGKLLVWSALNDTSFQTGGKGITQTAIYDPATASVTQYTVNNTGHDMFCPGLSIDFYGRITVTGGDTAARTSVFNYTTSAWEQAADMLISRGYQSQATLSDGNTFTIGGSWSGGLGGKIGEVYDVKINQWRLLPDCPVGPMLTNDTQGIYRQDNHAWLFAWKDRFVLQAGPSKAMNWYHVGINGSVFPAGLRGDDTDAMNGNAVMYDAVAGKILTVGGAPSYQESNATSNAHIITIGPSPIVTKINSMAYPRAFSNGVVLPDGSVFITGGQSYAVPFSDNASIMTPELWNPITTQFTKMATLPTPRNYHSVALLMPDATVFNGGGGLCGNCTTNHLDAQFYSPPYLFLSDGVTRAPRPAITALSAKHVEVGDKFSLVTDSPVASFAFMRVSSTTHAINTDQRRVPLMPSVVNGLNYTIHLPAEPGIVIPGYWMLFAIDAAGVPSVAETILVTMYHLPYSLTNGTGTLAGL